MESEKWKFTTTDDEYSFIIDVEIGKNPYNVAYDNYGPQVEDMYYKKVIENEQN